MGRRRYGRVVLAVAVLLAIAVLCVGCGSSVTYKDGTYTARSSTYVNDDGTDEGNGYGEVTITIEDGKIVAAEYKTYETDGTLKDEDYGKENGEVANRDYYNKAQKALAAATTYADELVEYGGTTDIEDHVDAISGATINYDHFIEAVEDALSQAEE